MGQVTRSLLMPSSHLQPLWRGPSQTHPGNKEPLQAPTAPSHFTPLYRCGLQKRKGEKTDRKGAWHLTTPHYQSVRCRDE